MILPREAVAGRDSLDLLLSTPDAGSPARLGLDDDDRRVGVFLRRLLGAAPSAYRLGSALRLGEGSSDERVVRDWGDPEPRGRWTIGARAQLLMRLERPVPAPLLLEFKRLRSSECRGAGCRSRCSSTGAGRSR